MHLRMSLQVKGMGGPSLLRVRQSWQEAAKITVTQVTFARTRTSNSFGRLPASKDRDSARTCCSPASVRSVTGSRSARSPAEPARLGVLRLLLVVSPAGRHLLQIGLRQGRHCRQYGIRRIATLPSWGLCLIRGTSLEQIAPESIPTACLNLFTTMSGCGTSRQPITCVGQVEERH